MFQGKRGNPPEKNSKKGWGFNDFFKTAYGKEGELEYTPFLIGKVTLFCKTGCQGWGGGISVFYATQGRVKSPNFKYYSFPETTLARYGKM